VTRQRRNYPLAATQRRLVGNGQSMLHCLHRLVMMIPSRLSVRRPSRFAETTGRSSSYQIPLARV
jgi:hypothetical protein